jgi:hypothetical protein
LIENHAVGDHDERAIREKARVQRGKYIAGFIRNLAKRGKVRIRGGQRADVRAVWNSAPMGSELPIPN